MNGNGRDILRADSRPEGGPLGEPGDLPEAGSGVKSEGSRGTQQDEIGRPGAQEEGVSGVCGCGAQAKGPEFA